MKLEFKKSICRDNYIRYNCFIEVREIGTTDLILSNCGYIVLEKYENIWNLELMYITIQGKGIGTKFLTHVLEKENINVNSLTVSAISDRSRNFFTKMGLL